jgi:hypothetical protein
LALVLVLAVLELMAGFLLAAWVLQQDPNLGQWALGLLAVLGLQAVLLGLLGLGLGLLGLLVVSQESGLLEELEEE